MLNLCSIFREAKDMRRTGLPACPAQGPACICTSVNAIPHQGFSCNSFRHLETMGNAMAN